DLDLKDKGLNQFEITLPIVLRREAVQQLKQLAAKTTPDHVWSSKTYTRSHELHGVTLVVHLGSGKNPALLEITYRRDRRPRPPKIAFHRVWVLTQFPACSDENDARSI